MAGNGVEFFQTVMGHAFYEGTAPRIAKALERIADALEKQNALAEEASEAKCKHGVPESQTCAACEE